MRPLQLATTICSMLLAGHGGGLHARNRSDADGTLAANV